MNATAGDFLIDAIADAVAAKLQNWAGTAVRLMDIEHAAAYLGMTVPALQHKAGSEIVAVRIDKRLRFDKRDLDKYIDRAPREGV